MGSAIWVHGAVAVAVAVAGGADATGPAVEVVGDPDGAAPADVAVCTANAQDAGYRGRVQSAAGLMMAVPVALTPLLVGALLQTVGAMTTCVVFAMS